jgi:cephalosporin hydroxylase
MQKIHWYNDNHLTLAGFPAYAIDGRKFMRQVDDYRDRLVIEKTRDMLKSYEELHENKKNDYSRIFEIGIFMGGSSAYLYELFSPEKMVSVDIRKKPLPMLEHYIQERGISENLRPRWGIDQGNKQQINRIINEEFGDNLLDLVIDDASHLLQPTLNSFNTLFPRLRPGGYYFIEDWKWAHGSPETPITGGGSSLKNLPKKHWETILH